MLDKIDVRTRACVLGSGMCEEGIIGGNRYRVMMRCGGGDVCGLHVILVNC